LGQRTRQIFILLSGIGVVLFTLGTIDGPPVTAAFLPVGILLLLPGSLAALTIGRLLGHLVPVDELASFLASLVAVFLNWVVWELIALAAHIIRRRNTVRT